jgi:hypothetical protein
VHPSVHATEGWVWARASRRRFAEASRAASGRFEETDRTADLAQGVEALDRALRSAQRVLDHVRGTELPQGVDWPAVRKFARRSREALAHGDDRLERPGFGYNFRRDGDWVVVFGRAKGEKEFREDSISFAELDRAAAELESWLDRESEIT